MSDNQFWITWWTRLLLTIVVLWFGTLVINWQVDLMMIKAGYTYTQVKETYSKSTSCMRWVKPKGEAR